MAVARAEKSDRIACAGPWQQGRTEYPTRKKGLPRQPSDDCRMSAATSGDALQNPGFAVALLCARSTWSQHM